MSHEDKFDVVCSGLDGFDDELLVLVTVSVTDDVFVNRIEVGESRDDESLRSTNKISFYEFTRKYSSNLTVICIIKYKFLIRKVLFGYGLIF